MPSLRSHQYSPYAPAKTQAKKIDAVSSRAVDTSCLVMRNEGAIYMRSVRRLQDFVDWTHNMASTSHVRPSPSMAVAGGQRMVNGRYIRTYSSVVGPRCSGASRGDVPERHRRQRQRLKATMPPLIETSFDNAKGKYLILGCPNIAVSGKLAGHRSDNSNRGDEDIIVVSGMKSCLAPAAPVM